MFRRRPKFVLTIDMAFDDPVYDDLLALLARERPADLALWRETLLAQFLDEQRPRRGDRPLLERIAAFVREKSEIVDVLADSRAKKVMSGRLLRQILDSGPELIPPEAHGRIRITYPRTATDVDYATLLDAYRESFPEEHRLWCETLVTLDKYHRVNEGKQPVPVAIGDVLERCLRRVEDFLRTHAWVQGQMALISVRGEIHAALRATIPPEAFAITPADEALRMDKPTDEEVLAYANPPRPEEVLERRFEIGIGTYDELIALLDMTWDVMAREKELYWNARRGERSSEALSHSARFRMMKALNADVLAAVERIKAERGWS